VKRFAWLRIIRATPAQVFDLDQSLFNRPGGQRFSSRTQAESRRLPVYASEGIECTVSAGQYA
jgi:hypothetical protein